MAELATTEAMSDMRVTSQELHQKPGAIIDQARLAPVVVTRHDRDHVVILSAEHYSFLLKSSRKALPIENLSDAQIAALAAADVPSEAEQRRILAAFEAAVLEPKP